MTVSLKLGSNCLNAPKAEIRIEGNAKAVIQLFHIGQNTPDSLWQGANISLARLTIKGQATGENATKSIDYYLAATCNNLISAAGYVRSDVKIEGDVHYLPKNTYE